MQIDSLLDALFPEGQAVQFADAVLSGSGRTAGTSVAVIGTAEAVPMGVEIALRIAGEILRVVREHPGQPIVLLVDTSGQRLSRRDELLGINSYLAHLAKSVEMARLRGHRVVSLVYSLAVSGGYLAWGMLADACFALPDAEIRVMGLPAMARVTKIPEDTLKRLSKTSPVFAPGVVNYLKMGALAGLWEGSLAEGLAAAIAGPAAGDRRSAVGEERGGRMLARSVAQQVRGHEIR